MSNQNDDIHLEDELQLRSTVSGRESDDLAQRLLEQLAHARRRLSDAQVVVIDKGRKTATRADDYVHAKPWTSIGASFAVGALVSWLLHRSRAD